jgi:hypothetical protein
VKPRCGRVMHRYEAVWGALLDDVTCGRPQGHNGQCRSRQSISKAQERSRHKWPEYRARTRQRKQLRAEEIRPQVTEAEEIRRQITESVQAAERQVRERELATRAVSW